MEKSKQLPSVFLFQESVTHDSQIFMETIVGIRTKTEVFLLLKCIEQIVSISESLGKSRDSLVRVRYFSVRCDFPTSFPGTHQDSTPLQTQGPGSLSDGTRKFHLRSLSVSISFHGMIFSRYPSE